MPELKLAGGDRGCPFGTSLLQGGAKAHKPQVYCASAKIVNYKLSDTHFAFYGISPLCYQI